MGLQHETMYTAMDYSQRINTLPGEVGQFKPSDLGKPVESVFRRLTPQMKQKLIGLGIALLTGSLTNTQAIVTLLRTIADQIENGGTTES